VTSGIFDILLLIFHHFSQRVCFWLGQDIDESFRYNVSIVRWKIISLIKWWIQRVKTLSLCLVHLDCWILPFNLVVELKQTENTVQRMQTSRRICGKHVTLHIA
jgi:hypothetical protein